MSQYNPTPFNRGQGESDTTTLTRLIGWLKTQLARIAQAINLETWYATTVTAAYTLTPQDRLLRVDTTGGAVTVTLPLANTVPGQVFTIKNIGANTVTVSRAGADTLDGATSVTIPPNGTDTIIAATATRWDRVPGFGAGLTYQTGTWTSVIGGSGGTSGQTYGTQDGRFVKVGRMVTVWFNAILTNKGTITTNVEVQGLPFPAASLAYGAIQVWNGLATAVIGIPAFVVASGSAIRPYRLTAASTLAGPAFFVTADLTNTTQFAGTFTYETDS